MNVVELEQKKALLVKFSKGKPLSSTLEKIQSKTSETVKILKSMQGGLTQISAVEVSPLLRSVESAVQTKPIPSSQKAVPSPLSIAKKAVALSSIPGEKAKKTSDIPKVSTPAKPIKTAKPKKAKESVVKKPEDVQKAVAQKEKPVVKKEKKVVKGAEKVTPQKPEVKDSLTEERRNKGIFSGLTESIKKGFERGDGRRRDKGLTDKEDVKETGMLALLGPIAPALQEIKNLAGDRDGDEPGRISKMVKAFKKKPDKVKPIKKPAAKRLKDERGRFIKASDAKKAESSKEVTEKLDIIHDDLVSGEKDQTKRDKKMMKAVRAGGGAAGGSLLDLLPGGGGRRKGGGVSTARSKGVTPAKIVPKKKLTLPGKKIPKITKAIPTAGAGGAISKLLSPLGKFAKILGKIAIPLAAVITIFEGVMGWTDAAKISDKKESDVTIGDKAQSAVSSVLSVVALGTVEPKTIFKEIDVIGEKTKTEISGELSRLQFGLKNLWKFVKGKEEPKQKSTAVELKQQALVAKEVSRSKRTSLKASTSGWESMSKRMSGKEDRSPRLVRKEKELQNKIDTSNKELISESKKTNELLKKLIEKENVTPMANNNIPNGITNQSDQLSISGLDESY